jgi:hypothetical protein
MMGNHHVRFGGGRRLVPILDRPDPAHPTAFRFLALPDLTIPKRRKSHQRGGSWREDFAKIPTARCRPAVARCEYPRGGGSRARA